MKYNVGIKEIHEYYIEVETDSTDKDEIKALAESKRQSGEEPILIEYVDTMRKDFWTVEKCDENV